MCFNCSEELLYFRNAENAGKVGLFIIFMGFVFVIKKIYDSLALLRNIRSYLPKVGRYRSSKIFDLKIKLVVCYTVEIKYNTGNKESML